MKFTYKAVLTIYCVTFCHILSLLIYSLLSRIPFIFPLILNSLSSLNFGFNHLLTLNKQSGRCFRMITERTYELLPPHSVPEMLRAPLESLILQVRTKHLTLQTDCNWCSSNRNFYSLFHSLSSSLFIYLYFFLYIFFFLFIYFFLSIYFLLLISFFPSIFSFLYIFFLSVFFFLFISFFLSISFFLCISLYL